MKFLLTPVTMILWYLTAYYGLYFTFVGMAFLFSLSWFWLIIIYTFLIGILYTIANGLPGLLRLYILKLYNFNKVSCFVHGLAGVFGVYQLISLFISNPPEIVNGDQASFIFTAMWDISILKTIFLSFPFIGIALSLIWSTTIIPFYLITSKKQLILKDDIEYLPASR